MRWSWLFRFLRIYYCYCVCACMCAMAYVWRLEDSSMEAVLSFHLTWVLEYEPRSSGPYNKMRSEPSSQPVMAMFIGCFNKTFGVLLV